MPADGTQPIQFATLTDCAHTVRDRYGDSGRVVGKCDTICYSLKDELVDQHDVDPVAVSVEEYYVSGPLHDPDADEHGNADHYLCVIDGRVVDGIDEAADIWVDLSLDQFCNYNVEHDDVEVALGPLHTLERVRVMEPDDDRRDDYTHWTDSHSETSSDTIPTTLHDFTSIQTVLPMFT